MNMFIHCLSLDIREPMTQAYINVKKGDTARKLIFTFSNYGSAYHISDGCTAVFRAKKPDGTILFNSCTINGNAVEYIFTSQTVAAVGIVECEVTLADETALTGIELFPMWAISRAYAVDDRVQYGGILYKCVQAHTSQADWTPDATQALWVVVSIEEFPEWVQPTGAHDAYNIGDKVSYNGQRYICTTDANVYAPGVYGWDLIT